MDINNTSTKVFLLIIVLLTGLVVTGAVVWSGGHPAGVPTVDIKNVAIDATDAFAGQENAPVTIAFWSDYQCPICKQFELNTLPQLLKEYADTGKVRIVFMDMAFLGNDSTDAALYGRSIWKLYPSQYLAWRTAMYTKQDEEGNVGFGNAASIDKLNATISGIDAAKVAADVQENKTSYQAAIAADRAEGQKANITGTPSFIIGTQLVQGARPYVEFKAAIDALLK